MKVDLTRIETADNLIRTKGTGTPEQLAKRLGLSKSSWYNLKVEMENRGAPILYSKTLRTYYYIEPGTFKIGFISNTAAKSFEQR